MHLSRDRAHTPPGVGTLMYVGDDEVVPVPNTLTPIATTVGAGLLLYALLGPKRHRVKAALAGVALIVY